MKIFIDLADKKDLKIVKILPEMITYIDLPYKKDLIIMKTLPEMP